MESGLDTEIATSVLQILILVFAGFATALYRIYDTNPDELSHDSSEVIAWLFMSYSSAFIYPIFLLTLFILFWDSGSPTGYLLLLLGAFVSIPIVILSIMNLAMSLKDTGTVDWRLYQRVINCASGIAVLGSFGAAVYYLLVL